MPRAQIDDNGTCIYYEDTGVPHGSVTYPTIVITHGALINSGMSITIFERMLPYASKYGLRIITMNNRGYHGSTPYTEEELAHLASPDVEVQAHGVRRLGQETAQFLAYVCQTLRIPVATGEGAKKEGGLVLVAWSMYGTVAVSILGDPRTMGSDLTATLAPYLRTVVFLDSPSATFGVFPDIGRGTPFGDPTIPNERKSDVFIDWVSAYHTSPPDGVPITAESLHEYYTVLPRTPTLRTLSPEDYQRVIELGDCVRLTGLIVATDEKIHHKYAHCAFSDAGAVLPDVNILYLAAAQAPWASMWGAKVAEELIGEAADQGKKKRKATFLRLKGANHLVQWDEPERLVRLLAESCNDSL
ncbi:uncharacterized protein PHACADRAFT_124572 [Phanerochaete carnosa HHB-10118-sp]|uniref:AB hydrolase-1 domain-containing protein n=1 Tax=Phanerochaete carnosa (strain HHB-10118-sp) TaxID=650164 RepID=K5UT26_PHACS|nr:uncharacterized protein PHACADRAFT_124572 [Phanerochaete carnosa HHB-10118-sp]EKM53111.1 hypothetical protein PHACADRAFT_124572 [Phanerochaete carnosa HHB-10118-sp]